MNPDQTSREEIELRITALLLGELSAEEAKSLRDTIAQDAGLQKLHDELAHTIVLVREVEKTSATSAPENVAPLKLSEERRAKLLAKFQTTRPADPLSWLKRIDVSRIQAPRLLTVLAVLAIVALLAAISLPNFVKARATSKSSVVINNLRQIDAAKQQWAVEKNKAADAVPTEGDLRPYLAGGKLPQPVAGETYVLGRVADEAVADINSPKARKELGNLALRLPTGGKPSAPITPTFSASVVPSETVTVAAEPVLAPSSTAIVLPPTEPPQLASATAEPLATRRVDSLFSQSDFSGEKKSPATASLPEQKAKGVNFETFSDADKLAVSDFKNSPDQNGDQWGVNRQPEPARKKDISTVEAQDRLASVQRSSVALPGLAGAAKPSSAEERARSRAEVSSANSSGGGVGGGGGGGGVPSSGAFNFGLSDVGVNRSAGVDAPANLGEEYRRNIPLGTASTTAAFDVASVAPQEKLSESTISGKISSDSLAAGNKFYRQTAGEIESVNGSIAPSATAPATPPAAKPESLFFAAGDFAKQAKESKPVDESGRGTLALDGVNRFMNSAVGNGGSAPANQPQDAFKSEVAKNDVGGLRYAMDPATGLPMSSSVSAEVDGDVKLSVAKTKGLSDDAAAKLNQPSRQILVGQAIAAVRKPTVLEDQPLPKATPNAPIPQPEILTRDNNFSTFSLNVSDVSFKLAAASLEKGQLPDAASIRSEEFINAFDYRDPEAAAGQPLAFASERARYPFAQNRDLLRFSVKTAAAGRAAGQPLNLVLLLDNSGSMERADRVAIIREALRVLATQLQPQDKISVVTFARTARLWADGVSGNQAGATLKNIGNLTPEGGTNLEEAMRLAYETAKRHYAANGLNRVVLLTDGAANLGDVNPADLKQKVEAQRKQGIALDCFGIGQEDYNDDLLEQLSRNGDGRYAFLNSPEEVNKEFAAKLAGALQIAASDVKVQVEFNPQRVTSYRQIGYAKHQLTKQQFRDNTVDAAEIAAQEAGNALYTVETKADGVGPIATVRVRYKVPGTTDYRERSWEVPYAGSAPSLDQASAAMRLAATASAFSEWLVASPFAQEVTPDELLKTLSGVPQIYGADQRPQKLEWMIRQAKSVAGK